MVEADETEGRRQGSFRNDLGYPTKVFIPCIKYIPWEGWVSEQLFIFSLLKGHLCESPK